FNFAFVNGQGTSSSADDELHSGNHQDRQSCVNIKAAENVSGEQWNGQRFHPVRPFSTFRIGWQERFVASALKMSVNEFFKTSSDGKRIPQTGHISSELGKNRIQPDGAASILVGYRHSQS